MKPEWRCLECGNLNANFYWILPECSQCGTPWDRIPDARPTGGDVECSESSPQS